MSYGSTDTPVAMRDLSVYLQVRPEIRPWDQLGLTDRIEFTSEVNLKVRYF